MKKYTLKEKLKALGPGMLVVGSFIGPGTITSSTRAGAMYGYKLLWCILFSVVAVIVMQGMASRLGIITQTGLSENLLIAFEDNPTIKKIMIALVSSAITLGGLAYMSGDLTGTAIGISAITGISSRIIAPIWGICILFISSHSDAIKWLEKLLTVCVSIMAVIFIITMFVVKPNIAKVVNGIMPEIPNKDIMSCVALIGTTVVPYNLFIHTTSSSQTWNDPDDIELAQFDVRFSMIIGGIITGAVLITAGTVVRGLEINSAVDMAQQLKPLLGDFAVPFLALGLIAAGISSAVITPLGVSYVLSGLFGWKLDKSDKRYFYTNIGIVIFGIIVSATGINPINIIIMAQAVNGIFLPISVLTLLYLASKKSIMGEYKNNTLQIILGTVVFLISLFIGISSIISLF
ncbi:Mn2+/Fe2+ NRAMP family transporter [Peptoniphilus olsenii]|uniref:Mn2+/Fe2+ NRAMP family transporter n=1 Tax=Peptoniphilus olsenii TaxID=411570 RepID=A0ABV2JAK9_9FIRM